MVGARRVFFYLLLLDSWEPVLLASGLAVSTQPQT